MTKPCELPDQVLHSFARLILPVLRKTHRTHEQSSDQEPSYRTMQFVQKGSRNVVLLRHLRRSVHTYISTLHLSQILQ